MKKTFLLLSLIVCAMIANGQGKPLPNWVTDKAPVNTNNTFYYKVVNGVGDDEITARNNAIVQAFQQADAFGGTRVNIADIYSALDKGTSCEVLSSQLSIPIYFTCEVSKKNQEGKWNYWILCQIATSGNTTPQFDTQFDGCNNHDYWDNFILPQIKEQMERDAKQKARDQRNANKLMHASDSRAIAASTFVPGVGQFLKCQNGAGVGFMLSEFALVGGGTYLYFLRQDQDKISKSWGITYNEYMKAAELYKTYNIAMWGCYGAAAVIHIINMSHAYLCADRKLLKKFDDMTLAPTLIPTNEFSNPQYTLGVGLTYNF